MNILFVTHDFALEDGGIPVFNYHICKELSDLGHKIFVLTNSFPGGENFSSQQNIAFVECTVKSGLHLWKQYVRFCT